MRTRRSCWTRIVEERWLTVNAVVGFWPANAIGDDIGSHTDETREKRLTVLHTLRQQIARDPPGTGRIRRSLTSSPPRHGLADYVGASP